MNRYAILKKQVQLLQGAEFYSCDYDKLAYPENSIIYCDIPYKDTKQYSTSKTLIIQSFGNGAEI